MIELTRFDGSRFFVNVEFIEFVETTPDTVISLIDHKKLLVRESAQVVVQRIADYHRQVAQRGPASVVSLLRWAEGRAAETDDHIPPEEQH
jgi:flagellar protein FlbD